MRTVESVLIPDVVSLPGPSGDSWGLDSYADLLRRLILLEGTCSDLKASNGCMRQQVMDLQSRTNEEVVSAGSLKLLAEPTRLLDEFTDAMDMGVGEGEKTWSIVERQVKAGSKAKAKDPISRSLANLSLVSRVKL
jgi:hypothetical protein